MLHLLLEALEYARTTGTPVPDCDLVVNTGDHPVVPLGGPPGGGGWGPAGPPPVFSIATTREHGDVPWPCFSFWDWGEASALPWPDQARAMFSASEARGYADRVGQAFWRGSDNGKFVREDGSVSGKRKPLVALADADPTIYNARFTRSTSPLSHVLLQDHCQYKLLPNLAGETYSARTKYLLACGSVVLQAEDPHFEFFQPLLQAGKHFVPVAADASDLPARVGALLGDPEGAERVGREGQQWVRECLRMADVYQYMVSALSAYASALTYDSAPAEGSAPVRSHEDIDAFF